jgi:hypothetical protein
MSTKKQTELVQYTVRVYVYLYNALCTVHAVCEHVLFIYLFHLSLPIISSVLATDQLLTGKRKMHRHQKENGGFQSKVYISG